MSKFLDKTYAALDAYTPGEQPADMVYIKLNTNESPYPPSPGVLAAVSGQEAGRLQLYPDPTCRILKEKIAELYGVKPENIFVANGSDDILNFAFMAYTPKEQICRFPDISYGFYQVFGDLHNASYKKVPLQEDFTIDHRDYCHADGMVVIANPNAPTGLALGLSQIREILDSNPDHVVLIDEAYIDFGGQSAAGLIKDYDNLLVVQTFSKSRSMAGARLGFAIADAAIIQDLERIKFSTNPYSINRLTMAAGIAALEENDYYMENCRTICQTRNRAADGLRRLGFTVLPSLTNFLFVKSDKIGGAALYQKLKEKGILVRHFSNPKIDAFNRITVGTPEQMETLLTAIGEILAEVSIYENKSNQ